ncbi:flagella assembly protein FlgT middle domain-containing protein [Methylomonas koyamae]|uniref:flagella assembly protein FlgT middle domain-containing protein n=1 Tax=Methylomonas koyamae TaxID=702114 RepID=UPI001E34C792|nr:flagella assembly protein FlgT middle domain-containing protein [Methylomonas koyamae]
MASLIRFNSLILPLLLALVLAACDGGVLHKSGASDSEANVSGRQTSVQGAAAIGAGGVEDARRAAIDDAVQRASSQLKRSNPAGAMISDIKVVDEWQDGEVYRVQALAVLSERQHCASPYRKKIVATGFPIMNAEQVSSSESQDLFSGIPREINNRLMETGDFIGRNLTNAVLYSRPDIAPEILPTTGSAESVIVNVARQYNAQFVLSGVIRGFRTESTEYVRGTGVLAEIKSMARDFIGRRSIDFDVFVHDGFSGALLFQQRYSASILGDVSLPNGYNVGSERFNDTPSGHKISELIQQASEDLHRLFGCYPFTTRVLESVNNRIVIAAGAQDKIRMGDKLMVYSAAGIAPNGRGLSDQVGILTINEVSANTAAGSLDSGAQGIVRPGDWVKSFGSP